MYAAPGGRVTTTPLESTNCVYMLGELIKPTHLGCKYLQRDTTHEEAYIYLFKLGFPEANRQRPCLPYKFWWAQIKSVYSCHS